MSKKLEEIKDDVSELTTAIRRLNDSSESLARSFGKFGASGNTTWNIISRLSSGTGFWRLQNRVRAVSNVFQEYFDRQTKSMESTLKNLDANLALEKSYRALKAERKDILESPIYEMFQRDAQSAEQAQKAAEQYYDVILGKIEKQTDKRKRAFRKSLEPTFAQRMSFRMPSSTTKIDYDDEGRAFKTLMKDMKGRSVKQELTFKELRKLNRQNKLLSSLDTTFNFVLNDTLLTPLFEILRPYGPRGLIGRSIFNSSSRILDLVAGKKKVSDDVEFDEQGRAFKFIRDLKEGTVFKRYLSDKELKKETKRDGVFKRLIKGIGKLTRKIRDITTLFAKAVLFSGFLLLLLPALLPLIKNLLKKFDIEDVKDFINRTTQLAMKGFEIIEKFARDVFSFYSALFKGDFDKARKMYMNFLNFVVDKIVKYGPIFLQKVKDALLVLGDYLGKEVYKVGVFVVDYLKSVFKVGKEKVAMERERRSQITNPSPRSMAVRAFSSGGMTSSGYSLVGEQGPELLKLPVGSRIRSNRETMGMIGTTNNITVQVTGRVGASDQEIKDIARKVSREINLQMNRTGSTAVRF